MSEIVLVDNYYCTREKTPVLHYSAVAGTHWKNSWLRADFSVWVC